MEVSSRATKVLAGVILLVDISTASNVYEMATFFEHPFFAVLVACAFVALQIGSLVLSGMPLQASTRRWLLCGTAILLFATGFSNVAMSYYRGHAAFPAETLLPALGFGGSAQTLSVTAAWVFGLALVIVGLIFWGAFAEFLRREQEQRQAALKAVDELLTRAASKE